MNLDAFRATRDHLQLHLHDANFRMEDWEEKDELASCGTAGCLAWHAVKAHGGDAKNTTWSHAARGVLGITYGEGEHLFATGCWPQEYAERYKDGPPVWESDDLSDDRLNEIHQIRLDNAKLVIELLDEILKRGKLWWLDE